MKNIFELCNVCRYIVLFLNALWLWHTSNQRENSTIRRISEAALMQFQFIPLFFTEYVIFLRRMFIRSCEMRVCLGVWACVWKESLQSVFLLPWFLTNSFRAQHTDHILRSTHVESESNGWDTPAVDVKCVQTMPLMKYIQRLWTNSLF